jgi:hypothetical protein
VIEMNQYLKILDKNKLTEAEIKFNCFFTEEDLLKFKNFDDKVEEIEITRKVEEFGFECFNGEASIIFGFGTIKLKSSDLYNAIKRFLSREDAKSGLYGYTPIDWNEWIDFIEKEIGRKLTDKEKHAFNDWVINDMAEQCKSFIKYKLAQDD